MNVIKDEPKRIHSVTSRLIRPRQHRSAITVGGGVTLNHVSQEAGAIL